MSRFDAWLDRAIVCLILLGALAIFARSAHAGDLSLGKSLRAGVRVAL